ncbi:hypothetical protein RHMOL_Rhmol01G0139200 [Rhododendron molle]|uniref:Uncharacterized protein n=1 Tax=Rhododendron molle TaxID=49168 RepID=A0ACC0Q493_RHOML|nr:hypothetical protein RHMOL_Rhmol01G0139200 [Rhododendron molle]
MEFERWLAESWLGCVCEHENPMESERWLAESWLRCVCEHENPRESERWLAESWLGCVCDGHIDLVVDYRLLIPLMSFVILLYRILPG